MADLYAKISSGVVVNTQICESTDVFNPSFIWVDLTSINPQPGIGWTYNGTTFIAPTLPATPPLNQQYSPADYGQMLIDQFTASNSQRGMTSTQLFQLASNLSPFYILLQCGSLQAFLDNLSSIPVDGVMITTAIITQFQEACEAYLAGD